MIHSPVHISTLQSAGTLSPDINWMTSPGTRSSARMFAVTPARIALHLIRMRISNDSISKISSKIQCDNMTLFERFLNHLKKNVYLGGTKSLSASSDCSD